MKPDMKIDIKTICVFCSSSSAVASTYFEAARELGASIARHNYALLYGGTNVGLMGAVADAAHDGGGTVIGVIPVSIQNLGIAYEAADELIVTADLRERKATMDARSDAFVVLPGGFGTLEELLEILTLKQLALHSKPIILLNVGGFYDPLVSLFEHFYRERVAKPSHGTLYHLAPNVEEVFKYIDAYRPVSPESKLF